MALPLENQQSGGYRNNYNINDEGKGRGVNLTIQPLREQRRQLGPGRGREASWRFPKPDMESA